MLPVVPVEPVQIEYVKSHENEFLKAKKNLSKAMEYLDRVIVRFYKEFNNPKLSDDDKELLQHLYFAKHASAMAYLKVCEMEVEEK